MSYKTNSIGNRLGISFGWNSDVYPSFLLHNYGSTVQNSVKLYFFVKEYLHKKNIMLVTYNYSKKDKNYSLFLNIYKYQKTFNTNRKNYARTKKKLIKSIQSDVIQFRKRTKKRFMYKWKRGYKKLRTNVGWRAINKKDLKVKTSLREEKKRKKKLAREGHWKEQWKMYIKKNKREGKEVKYKKWKEWKRWKEWNRQKKLKKLKSFRRAWRRHRRFRLKGWTFRINKINRFLKITSNRNLGRRYIRISHPEFYNNYISILALRFKLRLFLRSKNFNITNINISEPIKVANKKSIKLYSRSHWYRQIRNQKFFVNTIRLLHLMERFPNPAILADHFARELLNIRKKHWNLIRAFTTILKYWRFHNARLLNKKEAQRNKGRDLETKRILSNRWIPRYKLYSKHDKKKAIRGIKINIRGKINAADRARLKTIQEGIIPIQSFNKNVIYALAHARVKTGAFGIKVWLFT